MGTTDEPTIHPSVRLHLDLEESEGLSGSQILLLNLVFSLYLVIVAQVSMVHTYLQLCGENYLWWWRSFSVGASSGGFLACLALMSHLVFASGGKLFAQTLAESVVLVVLCGVLSLVAGTVSVLASWKFNFYLYAHLGRNID
jgi:transmembrane 9 superfamily member 2/4